MQIPASFKFVRSFDVAQMKEQQGPLSPELAARAEQIERATARGRETGAAREAELKTRGDGPLSPGELYEQREARLAEQAGYRRKVTPQQEALYHKAKAGDVNPHNFKTEAEAKDFVVSTLNRIIQQMSHINKFGGGDPTVGGYYQHDDKLPATGAFEKATYGRLKDYLEYNRMELVVQSALLTKSFDVDGPIHEVVDGQLRLGRFEISEGGKTLLRSTGESSVVTRFRADGTLGFDKYA